MSFESEEILDTVEFDKMNQDKPASQGTNILNRFQQIISFNQRVEEPIEMKYMKV